MNPQSQNLGGDTRAKISLPPMRLYPSSPDDLIYPGRTVDRAQGGVSTSHADDLRRELDRYRGTREVTSKADDYMRPSGSELRTATIVANPNNTGGVAVAGPNVPGHGMGRAVQQTPSYIQPEARNIALAPTHTAAMGSITGMFGGARPSHRLQGQVDEPHPHAHTQGRNHVPNQTPIASVPLLQGQRVQVQALPADTDPNFKIDIIVSGKIGYYLASTRGMVTKSRVDPGVARLVDNATMPLDDILVNNHLCVQRADYASEKVRARPSLMRIDPDRTYQFTLGHLISMLQAKQNNHWYRIVKEEDRTLQYLLGRNGGLEHTDTALKWDWCATAIRRCVAETYGGMWCYFLQLEVRIL